MKKVILSTLLVLGIGFTTVACNNDDDNNFTVITEGELPAAAKSFVLAHFSDATVTRIEKKNSVDADGTLYEVDLNNGIEIDFAESGEWLSVDQQGNGAIPTTFIPEKIVNYVTTNYPNINFNSIDIERNSYDVELTNDVDLIFDLDGNFVRVDP